MKTIHLFQFKDSISLKIPFFNESYGLWYLKWINGIWFNEYRKSDRIYHWDQWWVYFWKYFKGGPAETLRECKRNGWALFCYRFRIQWYYLKAWSRMSGFCNHPIIIFNNRNPKDSQAIHPFIIKGIAGRVIFMLIRFIWMISSDSLEIFEMKFSLAIVWSSYKFQLCSRISTFAFFVFSLRRFVLPLFFCCF